MEIQLETPDCGRCMFISVAVSGNALAALWGYGPAVTFLQIGPGLRCTAWFFWCLEILLYGGRRSVS